MSSAADHPELLRWAPEWEDDEALRQLLRVSGAGELLADLVAGPGVPEEVRGALSDEGRRMENALRLCRSDTGVWPRVVLAAARGGGEEPLSAEPGSRWNRLLFGGDDPGRTGRGAEALSQALAGAVGGLELEGARAAVDEADAEVEEAQRELRETHDWLAAAQAVAIQARARVAAERDRLSGIAHDGARAWSLEAARRAETVLAELAECRRRRDDPRAVELRAGVAAIERRRDHTLAETPEIARDAVALALDTRLAALRAELAELATAPAEEPTPTLHLGAVARSEEPPLLVALVLDHPSLHAVVREALEQLQGTPRVAPLVARRVEGDKAARWIVPLAVSAPEGAGQIAKLLARRIAARLAESAGEDDPTPIVVIEGLEGEVGEALVRASAGPGGSIG